MSAAIAAQPRPAPPPAIESRVLELVRLGLKVHDIAALLKVHPTAIKRMTA